MFHHVPTPQFDHRDLVDDWSLVLVPTKFLPLAQLRLAQSGPQHAFQNVSNDKKNNIKISLGNMLSKQDWSNSVLQKTIDSFSQKNRVIFFYEIWQWTYHVFLFFSSSGWDFGYFTQKTLETMASFSMTMFIPK